jgi:hypothetical protein
VERDGGEEEVGWVKGDVRCIKGEEDAGGGEGVVGGRKANCSGNADISRILRGSSGVHGRDRNRIGVETYVALLHLDSCHLCGSDIISNKLCVRCDDSSFCALNFILREEGE